MHIMYTIVFFILNHFLDEKVEKQIFDLLFKKLFFKQFFATFTDLQQIDLVSEGIIIYKLMIFNCEMSDMNEKKCIVMQDRCINI